MAIICSFCGKNTKDIDWMIAGLGAFICNECVDICKQMIDDLSKFSVLESLNAINPYK